MVALVRSFLDRIVKRGTLDVEMQDGRTFAVGDGTGEPVAIRFMDRTAARWLVFNPALALGELYVDGRIVVTRGTIYDFLALIASNLAWQSAPGFGRALERLRRTLRPLEQHNSKTRAVRNVAVHYDLDRRLYDLFLDADRQYSCAYFQFPGQSLDEAQLAKKRHIAAKLLVEPGHRVLDIGCGWGGMALYLARNAGARVTGITLSQEQLSFARARAARSASPGAEFLLQDYRDTRGAFDRIVSVGMFEHVGVPNYDAFFAKAAGLLSEDGVMLLHSIGRMEGPSVTNPWIERYIFPGGYIPALSEVMPAIERAGLVVADVEILRLHYAETLRHWRQRFDARREEARALYDDRFCRVWEFYLAGSEVSFRHSSLMVFQIQLARRQDAVPLTRDYIAARELELQSREAADPGIQWAAE